MSLSFHMPMLIVYEKYNDRRLGTYIIEHVKSIQIERYVDQEPLAFCT
jgi:hypothetical protein